MSDAKVRQALETRLAQMTPALDTVFENTPYTPKAKTPYQRIDLMRAPPENPEMTGAFRRLLGVLQVTLFYPQQKGPAEAEARADAVAAWFPANSSYAKDSVVVTIDGSAYIMAGFQDGDRWAVPVRIPYFSNISS